MAEILIIGIFSIVAVMILTAMITMIAPYVAALLVLMTVLWLVTRTKKKKPP